MKNDSTSLLMPIYAIIINQLYYGLAFKNDNDYLSLLSAKYNKFTHADDAIKINSERETCQRECH